MKADAHQPAAGLTPAFGVVATCVARGPAFHGSDGVEAAAHAGLLGTSAPVVGFLANGELGPRQAPHTWREEEDDDDEDDEDAAPERRTYALHAYTTCLGFHVARR